MKIQFSAADVLIETPVEFAPFFCSDFKTNSSKSLHSKHQLGYNSTQILLLFRNRISCLIFACHAVLLWVKQNSVVFSSEPSKNRSLQYLLDRFFPHFFRELNHWPFIGEETSTSSYCIYIYIYLPIPSMGRTVYLPTFDCMVKKK